MNGNDASQDLRQLTEKSKNRNGGRTRTARISSSERKFLTPVFQYKGASQFVMNIFRSVKSVGVQNVLLY